MLNYYLMLHYYGNVYGLVDVLRSRYLFVAILSLGKPFSAFVKQIDFFFILMNRVLVRASLVKMEEPAGRFTKQTATFASAADCGLVKTVT